MSEPRGGSGAAEPYTRLAPTDDLVDRIARRFRLGPVGGWTDLGGSWTTNLRLDGLNPRPDGSGGREGFGGAGSLVARVHQGHSSVDRVLAEQAARRVLADAGLPTVVPLADPDGGTVHQVADRPVEIERFVPWTDQMNSPERLRSGFALAARMHDVLRHADLPLGARSVDAGNHIAADRAVVMTRAGARRLRVSGDPALMGYADAVERHVETVAAAEEAYAADQVVQVVHGDFWDNNVLFADGRVTALLDFGFMAVRPRIDDLALTVWFWLLEPGSGLPGEDSRALVAELLDAYDAHTSRPLSAAERASLPLAVARQPAWSVGGWVVGLDAEDAYRHARKAAPEHPVAATVLADLGRWQDALVR